MKSGKRLEANIKDSCKKQGILCERFKDSGTSFGTNANIRFTSSNPSDFILFDGFTMLYLEAKNHKGKSLPIGCIRETQYEQMMERSMYKNVVCGFLINFEDLDIAYFLNVKDYDEFLKLNDRKSISIDYLKEKGIEVFKTRKRTNAEYNISNLFFNIA
jgi:recombination protein U